jgi:hypothetical protein
MRFLHAPSAMLDVTRADLLFAIRCALELEQVYVGKVSQLNDVQRRIQILETALRLSAASGTSEFCGKHQLVAASGAVN